MRTLLAAVEKRLAVSAVVEVQREKNNPPSTKAVLAAVEKRLTVSAVVEVKRSVYFSTPGVDFSP